MTEKQSRFRKFMTDRNISLLIRWWAAGAVYFFIGWGTAFGRQETIIDFVFTLGLVIGLFNILIINPGMRLMFKIGKKRSLQENTFWQKTSDYLVELIKSIFIVFVVAMIYLVINRFLVLLFPFPSDAVPLSGEPILFGLFYLLVFLVIEWCTGKIKAAISKSRTGTE